VLRDALRAAGKVGLGQLSVRGAEKLVAVKPCGKGLLLETLRYADEVRKGQSFFGEIGDDKPDEDLLDLATSLIDKKTAPFDASEFEDRYAQALRKLIDTKAKAKDGKRIVEDAEEPAATGGNVIDLMAALKKSVAAEKGSQQTGEGGGKEHRAQEEIGLIDGPHRPTRHLQCQARFREDARALWQGAEQRGRRSLHRPEARCDAAALGPAAGDGRGS
jgi:non-homologous end joining protein Ku